uniref:protein-ribulosamine 3-kinase n=1 Tax=Clastoptera arizonana TaxID=38151 RepID=A0A1B6D3G5_9HEMI
METILKSALKTNTLTRTGQSTGGCINQGEAYITDNGTVFVKRNTKSKARLMFDGEYEGLQAIAATRTVMVPKPIIVLDNPDGGACLIMEYLNLKGLRKLSHQLGKDLAHLHLYNISLSNQSNESGEEYISQFGFQTTTCCGYIPQDNSWQEDWVSFFAQNRLDYQFKLLEKNEGRS